MVAFLRKYYLFLLIHFAVSCINFRAAAQTFNYKIFSPDDGLPAGAIGLLFTDSRGYIWAGSCAGLSRYDGKKFTNYSLEDGLPFLCNFISLEDSAHNIWGASHNGVRAEVIKFSGGKFITVPFDKTDSVSYIFSLSQINGEIYACTSIGVFRLRDNRWEKISLIKNPPVVYVRNIVSFKDSALLINYYTSILLKKKDGIVQVATNTADCRSFNTILHYKKNVLIVGYNRLFVFDEKGLHPVYNEVIKHQRIYNAMVDSKNRIWVSAEDDGILVFDKDSVLHFGLKDGLPSNLSIGFCEDREGNTWLGTIGLIQLRPSYIQQFKKENGLASNDVRSAFIAKDGKIFFGHAGNGFSYYDAGSINTSAAITGKKDIFQPVGITTSFTEDNKGRITFTTNLGYLFRFKNRILENLTEVIKKDAPSLETVFFNPHDSCLYVSSDSIIFKIKNDKVTEEANLVINNKIALLNSFFIDRYNNFWVSITDNAFGIYNWMQKKFQIIFNGASATQFLQDLQGNIWVATFGKGIFHFVRNNQNHFYTDYVLTKKDGLSSNIIKSIALDSTGKLWAVCYNGITSIDLNRRNSEGHLLYQNFNTENGINAKSFIESDVIADKSGNIWVSTSDGVLHFTNSKIFADTLAPKMQIEKATLLNDSSGWNDYTKTFSSYFHLPLNPVLPYNKNSLNIFYNGITFSNNNEVEYAYRLDGLDTNWNNNITVMYASFINLSPGNYTFRVKSRKKNYAWSEEAIFAFTISPPFWETWWFRLLIILAVSALLIFVFRLRIQQVRRKALLQQQMQELELKALKAQMNPHFIFNAMNSIQSLVMNDKPEEAVRYLGKFAKLLRQVLDNSDKTLILLEQELSSLQLYIELEALRLHKDFDYNIHIAEEVLQDKEMVPPLLLQPYIENALWHGLSHKDGERKLQVSIAADDKFLVCKIIDNGIGRIKAAEIKSKASLNISKGLNITQRRLSLMNEAEISPVVINDLYDEEGNATGTEVVIMIKRSET